MIEEQNKWISKLLGFDFEIQYKPRTKNRVVDAFSRRMLYSAISTVKFFEWEELEVEVERDEKLGKLIQDLLMKRGEHSRYTLKRGILYYQDMLVIPKGSLKINLILKEFHDSAIRGHSCYFCRYKRISRVFYWEGMRKKIQDYV